MILARAKGAGLVLFEAYSTGRHIADIPLEFRPTSEAEAYEVQDAFICHLGAIGGWKLSVDKPGRPAIYSPVPAERILPSPAVLDLGLPIVSGVEIELAIRFSATLAARDEAYEEVEVVAAIGSVHAAFELCGSRYIDKAAVSKTSILADLQANVGMVVGDGLAAWQDFAWTEAEFTLSLNGHEPHTARSTVSGQVIISSLTWMVNRLRSSARSVQANDIVLTGAPFSPITVGGNVIMTGFIEGLGQVKTVCF